MQRDGDGDDDRDQLHLLLVRKYDACKKGPESCNRLFLRILTQPDTRDGVPPCRGLTATQRDVGGETGAVVDQQLLYRTCIQVARIGVRGIQQRVEQSQDVPLPSETASSTTSQA